MARYDYLEVVVDDVLDYVWESVDLNKWKGDREGLAEKLNEDLWVEDSVTGNASGSYTFNTYQAEENLSHNWDLIVETADAFGIEPKIEDGYEHGAEWWDVSIRCYLLPQAIEIVLDELDEQGALDELEEGEEIEDAI